MTIGPIFRIQNGNQDPDLTRFLLKQKLCKIFSKNRDSDFGENYAHEMFVEEFVYLVSKSTY